MVYKLVAFAQGHLARARQANHRALVFCLVLWDAAFAFATEEALIRAGSLAFTSLVSIVPLTTVALRLMTFYGVSQDTSSHLEGLLAQYFLPAQSQDIVKLILGAAAAVTENVGLVGLGSFCVTLVLLAREVESHVLKICNRTTTWSQSLLSYLVFLVLAPSGCLVLLLLLQPFFPWIDSAPFHLGSLNYPFALSICALLAMLRVFSGYTLGWRACSAGALASAFSAWAAWKVCLVYFDHSVVLTSYGSLACFPAFLLWLFTAWCCVLFGVQVAAKTQVALERPC